MDTLELLLLEDNPLDAELTLATLQDGGLRCAAVRVETEEEFAAELERRCPDVILADFSLPAFDGICALSIARRRRPHVPFIFVSGALGEELAIETLKQGATDYVLKHRLERLVPSVQRALREVADRAERERLEEELRQRADELAEADRRKDEFLAVLAHELRNPLAPLFNALHVMRQPELDPGTLEKTRDVVERQVRHMAHLLDDLMDISRITRGKILLRRERLDLGRVLRETAEDHRSALAASGITLDVDLPERPLWMIGDPTRLAQVLGNLLHNAAKFTPSGGQVAVRLTAAPGSDHAELSIRDTGLGIDPGMLPRLFQPFMQEQRSLETSRSGLGLGLALVKGLVELHGGEVRARSDGPGRGSEFTCIFPLAEHAAEPARDAPASPGSSEPLRVLIIDDNEDAADTLRDLLELAHHEVEVAYRGPEGIELARRFRPQVVLGDLGLPGMDGYAVAQALRRDPRTASARLIAVSGYGQEEDRRRSREAGFDLHLTKPVDPEDLRRVLAGAVSPARAG